MLIGTIFYVNTGEIFRISFQYILLFVYQRALQSWCLKSLMVVPSLGGVFPPLFLDPSAAQKQRGEVWSPHPHPAILKTFRIPTRLADTLHFHPYVRKLRKSWNRTLLWRDVTRKAKNMQKWRLGKSFLDIPVPLGDFVWFLSDSIFGYALYYVCRQDVNFMCAFGIFPCKHIECMWRKLVGENQTSLLSLFGDDVWAWNH